MGKQFKLADDARSDQIVPALDMRVVTRGETVEFPDEFVEGLRGNTDWQPAGWTWPEALADPPAADPPTAPAAPPVTEPPAAAPSDPAAPDADATA